MSEGEGAGNDPGWLPAVRRVPASLIWYFRPGVPVRRAEDPLVAMRAILVVWAAGLVLLGLAALLVAGSVRSIDGGVVLGIGVAVVGTAACGAAAVSVERKRRNALRHAGIGAMPTQGAAALYRQSFFLRGAFSNSAALSGLVGVRLAGVTLPYAIGLLAGAVGLALTAPTAGNIRRYEQTLGEGGNDLDLVEALRTPISRPQTRK